MNNKEEILKLKDGEKYIVPESDYGKCEVWKINDMYFIFEIPFGGGEPMYDGCYPIDKIDCMIIVYESWS